jgi:hypothetical protein
MYFASATKGARQKFSPSGPLPTKRENSSPLRLHDPFINPTKTILFTQTKERPASSIGRACDS